MEPAFTGVPTPLKDRAPVKRAKTGTSSPEKTLLFDNKYMATAKIHSAPTYDLYLEGVRGIPKLFWHGTEDDLNVLALELTGPNLKFLLKTRNRGFSLKTTLMLADQMLKRIEYVHTKGLLHRDIKPANFAIGLLEQSNTVYLINFEHSKHYKSRKNNQHKPYAENKEMISNATFSSINCHLGIEPSRRDDLESFGYSLVYLYKGYLPWEGTEGSSTKEKIAKIMDKKIALPSEALCKGMPDAFPAYFNYCKALGYDEKPDYKFIRDLFRKVMFEKELSYDNCFDWVNNQQTSTENLVYEFGDLSISFKGNPQTDLATSNISNLLNKSKLSYQSKMESDAFSQEEQQTSNIVPIDLSIALDNNERPFPSKTVLMPSSISSIATGLRNVKTNHVLGTDNDDDLKYNKLGTASTMNKTVSMKVPETENYKNRSTTYNIVFEDDDIPVTKVDADIEEIDRKATGEFRRTNTDVKSSNDDVEEHKLTPRGNDKKGKQNSCALF